MAQIHPSVFMGAVVLDGAQIGANCIVGAGSLVPMGTVIPDGSVAFGNPVLVRRAMTERDIQANLHNAARYVELAAEQND